MADGTPLIIWVTNAQGEIEFVNRAYSEFFGFTFEEIKDMGWQPLVHPEDQTSYTNVFLECLRERTWFNAEGRVQRKDGEWRWIDSYGQPRFSPSGEYLGMAGSSVDVTPRKRAESIVRAYTEQLMRSNEALQDFAFMASHDLREPLRKIQAFSNRLADYPGSSLDEQEHNYLVLIRQAAERMHRMLDGLLAYSRVTIQSKPFESGSLNRVAEEVISDLQPQLEETGGNVDLGELPVIEADSNQMRQLLQNLIGNAIKFHRPGISPHIRIYSQPTANDCIQLIVADNGIGFEMEYASHLFKPFHRLVGKTAYEGSGMGLAICQKIVERHGGSITAQSEPGVGSTFTVTLPRKPKV
jgi:PAS domain S-box-containing protein